MLGTRAQCLALAVSMTLKRDGSAPAPRFTSTAIMHVRMQKVDRGLAIERVALMGEAGQLLCDSTSPSRRPDLKEGWQPMENGQQDELAGDELTTLREQAMG